MREPRYLAVVPVFAIGAWLAGGGLPAHLLVLACGMAVADLVWARLCMSGLSIRYRAVAGPFSAGEGIRTEIEVRRRPHRAAALVFVHDAAEARLPFTAAAGDGETLTLGAGATRTSVRRILPALRGRYRLGPLEISAQGPFGLVAAVCRVEGEEVTVWPRVWALPAHPAPVGRGPSGVPAAARGAVDPVTAIGVRSLLPTDPPRLIHWKRSAALGGWYVRELDAAASAVTLVVLDLAAAAYPDDRRVADAAVEVAASLVQAALARGETVRLRTTGATPLDLSLHGRALPLALEALAQAEPDGPQPLAAWLRQNARRLLPTGGGLVAVSPVPLDAWGGELARARGLRLATAGIEILGPSADPVAAGRRTVRLHGMGVAAWAVAGAQDLARQVTVARHVPAAEDREAAER